MKSFLKQKYNLPKIFFLGKKNVQFLSKALKIFPSKIKGNISENKNPQKSDNLNFKFTHCDTVFLFCCLNILFWSQQEKNGMKHCRW